MNKRINLTNYEKLSIVDEQLSDVIRLRSLGLVKGKTRDIISEKTGLSPIQVQRYMTILKKGNVHDIKELENDNITLSECYDASVQKY